MTAVFLAEIGEDRSRYPQDAVLLAEAGLAPVTRASGRSSSVRFRYAANTRLREAATWWAFNSMKESLGRSSIQTSARRTWAALPPRAARTGRPMDTRPVALLAGRHQLRPGPAHQRRSPDRLTRIHPHPRTTACAGPDHARKVQARTAKVDSGSLPHPLRRQPHDRNPEEQLGLGQGAAALDLRPARH